MDDVFKHAAALRKAIDREITTWDREKLVQDRELAGLHAAMDEYLAGHDRCVHCGDEVKKYRALGRDEECCTTCGILP